MSRDEKGESMQASKDVLSRLSEGSADLSDIAKEQELMSEIIMRDRILSMTGKAASLLLATEPDKFEDNLIESIGMMSAAVGASRGYICKNHICQDELYLTQLYEWHEDSSAARKSEYLANVRYRDALPGWEDILSAGECISVLTRDIQNNDVRDMLLKSGVLSVLIAPIFVRDDFWGFVGFDNLSERIFSENETSALRPGCLLIGSAFLHNDMVISLKKSADEAKAASRYKSKFLANMSHEIRTPMNVILGVTDILLLNKRFDNNVYEQLLKIHSSGETLLGIINNMLDLSKIEAGKLELMVGEYDSASLISDTVVLNLMRMESKPIDFKLNVDASVPVTLFGDVLRIKQILNNLLSNAFKYTEEGVVALSFSIENESTDDGLVLVIHVRDTGYGMTDEQLNALFDEYARFNQDTSRTTEGTGLGMSITRDLLKLMGGEIAVKSEPHKGTLITVRIPQGSAGTDVLGKEIAARLQDFRAPGLLQTKAANVVYEPMPYGSVLVVDDVESNLLVAKGLLAPYDLSVDAVTSGFQALDRIKAGYIYDIIFMDHMMPKMDGIETVKKIREMGYNRPIVALTANAILGQMDIFLSNGFNDFISKPIDVRYVNAVLKKYVRDKQPTEVIEAACRQVKNSKNAFNQDAHLSVSASFMECFVRDAFNAISVLERIAAKSAPYSDDDFHMYTTSVHAMKTTLFYAGERHLSVIAGELENAGWNKNIDIIVSETQGFVDELKAVVLRFSSTDIGETSGISVTEEDYKYLRGKLSELTQAFKVYDKRTSKGILAELMQREWPPDIKNQLDSIPDFLLGGDIEGVFAAAAEINESIDTYLSDKSKGEAIS